MGGKYGENEGWEGSMGRMRDGREVGGEWGMGGKYGENEGWEGSRGRMRDGREVGGE